jgi:hypothetical protein
MPLELTPLPDEDRLELVVRAAFVQGAVQPGNRVVVMAERAVEDGERVPTVRVVRVGEGGRSYEP